MGIYAELHSLVDQFRNQNRDTNKRIKALEGQVELNLRNMETLNNHIEELEKQVKPALFTVTEPTVKDDVPTDKDRPHKSLFRLQVRDIIELYGGGLRSVLEIKPNRDMNLMDVETGDRWWTSQPDIYTLVYRPRFPDQEKG